MIFSPRRQSDYFLDLFSSQRSVYVAMVGVPLFFGLLSLFYGQASGYDFFNYHVYNGYAFVHGRLSLDLAPAGFQSYFNPVLDSVYYLMTEVMPPKLVGFIMGFVPALVFIPLWLTANLLISRSALFGSDTRALSTIIALAGVFSASFVGRTGSVDGDSVTALFQILALYFLLKHVVGVKQYTFQIVFWLLIAGFISGCGVGLKLTGAPAGLAILIGLLFVGQSGFRRLVAPLLFGVGAAFGVAVTGGYWFFEMYQNFGNPLFPQFSSIFPSALASSVSVIDQRYLPSGFLDYFIWPFNFLFNPAQFDGAGWPQFMWPFLYVAGIVFLIKKIRDDLFFSRPWVLQSGVIFVILYTVVGFFAWMLVFSIYRYQIYFALTAPLVALFFIRYLFSEHASKRIIVFMSVWSVVLALFFGIKSYEGESWSERYIQASPDAFVIPSSATVLFVGQPMAWIAPFFPPSASLVGIGTNFPISDGYKDRANALIAKNPNTYAIFVLPTDYRSSILARANNFLGALGINRSLGGCHAMKWIVDHTRLHASIVDTTAITGTASCRLVVSPADEQKYAQDVTETKLRAGNALSAYGYDLGHATCSIKHAFVGRRIFSFELCQLPSKSAVNPIQ